ncbi:MAG: S8 family serine peptidase [Methylococcaceae bacterium]
MTNPNLIHSLRIFDLLLGPIQRILKRILPDQTEENLRDENFRRMVLVPLVDRILLSQVPEAALVPNGVRHALIERALDTLINDILIPESAANATVAGGEGIEGAMVAAGLPLIPTKIGLGVKAITLEIAEGVDAAQLQSEALSTTGAGWAFSQIPELPGFFRLKPKPDTHPTVSEAWDLATELSDLQSVAYAEPSIAQLPIAADAAPVAGIAGFGMQDHKVPGALADAQWSLKLTKAQDLWGAHQGHGIPIGHVDTGYTHHPEIFQNVDVFHGWDSWDNDKNAEDDLDPSFWDRLRTNLVVPAQPGHGTATSSIIASPVGKQSGHIGVMEVTGTAPQATIIPIRATPTVAILPTGSQEEVASGISAAVNRGARVISMSLGSPWGSRPLNIAVQRALDAGVIVCAAAGNVVLWEGAFTEVM